MESLADDSCSDALFGILVEGLADRFEPRLCDDYAAIFSQVAARAIPQCKAADLYARYQRVRQPRICLLDPERVVVLSRVTLGADIAVTSVLLEAVKHRFPGASICLAGSAQAAGLFARDSRIQHLETAYPRRGPLTGRLACWRELASQLTDDRTIVVDPDSRLTQLGLLPVCEESRYFFFESRAFGGDTGASLAQLAAQWATFTFDVPCHAPRIAPPAADIDVPRPFAAVSLGVGGSAAKCLPEDFESELVRLICRRFRDVVVDCGSGPEEAARVERAIAGTRARSWTGSFARFASVIAAAACYVGYDSGPQHAAAALGTPLLTLFKGFVSDRMFARWQPAGPGPKEILKIRNTVALSRVASALDRLVKRS